jgi:hypothetical protein
LQRTKSLTESTVKLATTTQVECTAEKDGVDELSELMHNLSSLLLTNTTIRRTQQGSTEYDL